MDSSSSPNRGRGGRRGGRGGRGKGKNVASSSHPIPIFRDDEFEESYNKSFKHRKVILGKVINFTLLQEPNLRVYELYYAMGWIHFLSLNKPIYPTLVRHFYTNMLYDVPTSTIDTTVSRINIGVNKHSIRHMFQIPEGNVFCAPSNSWVEEIPEFVPLEAIRLICNNPNINIATPPAYTQLPLVSHILQLINSYCILPRSGSHTFITHFDVFLLWCIYTSTKLDLGRLVVHHMRSCASKKKSPLPYGMALTHIFQFHGISLRDQEDETNPTEYDTFDERQLRLMGFARHTQTDLWVPRDQANVVINEQQEAHAAYDDMDGGGQEGENLQQDQPMPQAPPYDQYLQRFDNIDAALQNIQQTQAATNDRIDRLYDYIDIRFNNQFDYMQSAFGAWEFGSDNDDENGNGGDGGTSSHPWR